MKAQWLEITWGKNLKAQRVVIILCGKNLKAHSCNLAGQEFEGTKSCNLVGQEVEGTIGGRVVQLVEYRTLDSMTSATQVRTPSGAQDKFVSFSQSKMLCWLAVSVPNPCVYVYARIRLKNDPNPNPILPFSRSQERPLKCLKTCQKNCNIRLRPGGF